MDKDTLTKQHIRLEVCSTFGETIYESCLSVESANFFPTLLESTETVAQMEKLLYLIEKFSSKNVVIPWNDIVTWLLQRQYYKWIILLLIQCSTITLSDEALTSMASSKMHYLMAALLSPSLELNQVAVTEFSSMEDVTMEEDEEVVGLALMACLKGFGGGINPMVRAALLKFLSSSSSNLKAKEIEMIRLVSLKLILSLLMEGHYKLGLGLARRFLQLCPEAMQGLAMRTVLTHKFMVLFERASSSLYQKDEEFEKDWSQNVSLVSIILKNLPSLLS